MLVAALFNSGLKNISLFEDIAIVYIHLTRWSYSLEYERTFSWISLVQ